MSGNRIWTLAWSDARLAWRKPLPLVMLTILVLLMWGSVAGNVTTSVGGGGDIGGKRVWANSETSLAFLDLIFLGLIVPFFVAVQCGMVLAADEDRKLDRVLLSTPLSPQEYALGRFLGALLPLLGVLAVYVGVQMLLVEFYPRDTPDLVGPFRSIHYLRPLALYTLPLVLFTAGTALFLGTLTRQAVLVFLVPTVLVIGGALFLWDYSPNWLPAWINRWLEWGDPAGVRWYLMRFLKEPRGADFMNSASVVPEGPMLLSRALFALLGLGLVPWSGRLVARRVQGVSPGVDLSQIPVSGPAPLSAEGWVTRPLPVGQRSRPGFWATTWAILTHELRSLLRSPGLWIFGPLIVLQVASLGAFRLGPFETFVLATPGSIAGESFNTLTLLLILLILFYSVEGLVREQRHGLAGLVHSTPASTAALLTGKVLANGALAVVIAAGACLGATLLLVYQSVTNGVSFGLQPGVFALIWGLLLAPTLIVWSAFVTLIYSLTLNRYVTYALSLAALIATGLLNRWGYLNWATRWHMWSGVRWSELDRLGASWNEMVWNRLLMLCVSAVLVTLALRVYPRRVPDARGLADRMSPRPLLRAALPVVAWALPALMIAIAMLYAMRAGPDGGPTRRQAKDYWKQNISTWKDQPVPALDQVTATIDLHPETRSFRVRGEYLLRNRSEQPMEAVPLSVLPHLQVSRWTVDGLELTPVKPIDRQGRPSIEDRSGLMVIRPATPLAVDATCRVGFELAGSYPRAWPKGAVGSSEFVLPSGIVLTSFDGTWLPVIGFVENVGLAEADRPESREYSDQHHLQRVDPGFGPAWGTNVELTISAPADWTINSVGEPGPAQLADGRQTRTWKTTVPVRFFNIVGGPASLVATEGRQSTVFHDQRHAFHARQMAEMLDAAREHYGEWFHPYPWQSLRLTEFPGLASYAQGFPGNITFSESIGFLAHRAAEGEADTVDFIVAHEAAHQWWGNILTPGKGPGGNVLSEGMANFSAALLVEQMRGPATRRALLKKFEQEYVEGRNPDRERPLHKVDGSRPGDNTLIYNRGGWVFWMLMEQMGRERMLTGLRDFIERFKDGPDFPLLEDLVETLRPHAEDPEAYDTFVGQWVLGKVLPEFQLEQIVQETDAEGRQVVTGQLVHVGTGSIEVDIALESAPPPTATAPTATAPTETPPVETPPSPNPGGSAAPADRSPPGAGTGGNAGNSAATPPAAPEQPRPEGSWQRLRVGPGETVSWRLTREQPATEVVVDPDVRVLQLGRKLARKSLR